MKSMRHLAVATLAVSFAISTGAAFAQYGPPPPPPGPGYGQGQPWEAPPQELRDVARQGFLDGLEGARKDFGNHRRPNVNNRDEYRHPNVPGNVRHDYRQGFRRGYSTEMQHIYYGAGPRPY